MEVNKFSVFSYKYFISSSQPDEHKKKNVPFLFRKHKAVRKK